MHSDCIRIFAIWTWFEILFLLAPGIQCVSIVALKVPESVRNGSESGAILDCMYHLHPQESSADSGLVVKWFFGRSPNPVYQWIHNQKPQDAGILKGRLKLDYKASNNSVTMYRALYIKRPTIELSGEYKCLVSTYDGEDFMMKTMTVYVQERKMDFFHHRQGVDMINVSCRVDGVYPKPKLFLYKDPEGPDAVPLKEVTTNVDRGRGGSYDVTTSAIFSEDGLEAPTVFDCELQIPSTFYVKRKTILYFPGAIETLSSLSGNATAAYKRLCLLHSVMLLIMYRFNIFYSTGGDLC